MLGLAARWWSCAAGAFRRLRERLYLLHLREERNVRLAGALRLNGLPIIDVREGCALEIGDNVLLNSENRGYHLNMHSPVKLLADRAGARITIGDNTRVHGSCIHAYNSVSIGRNCLIAANCQIIDGHGHDLSFPNVEDRIHTKGSSKPVVVEDNVWIGANTIVLPGVTIGRGSVVAASSVVSRSLPPMVVAGGNPAVVIRECDVA